MYTWYVFTILQTFCFVLPNVHYFYFKIATSIQNVSFINYLCQVRNEFPVETIFFCNGSHGDSHTWEYEMSTKTDPQIDFWWFVKNCINEFGSGV